MDEQDYSFRYFDFAGFSKLLKAAWYQFEGIAKRRKLTPNILRGNG